MNLTIRPLNSDDHGPWLELWKGYQMFYKTDIPADATKLTWQRFQDENEPVFALGAFENDVMLGIVHYIFHRSTWTVDNYCYLQDLFTVEAARGKGVGRTLIEAVYEKATAANANRVYWLTQEGNSVARILCDRVATASGFVQYKQML